MLFRANRHGTCALCGLAISRGQQIIKVPTTRTYYGAAAVSRNYAHIQCAKADIPSKDDTIQCPDCGMSVRFGALLDHLQHAYIAADKNCPAYRFGASEVVALSRRRDVMLGDRETANER